MKILAIDIGGTGIKYSLATKEGVLSQSYYQKTPQGNLASVPAEMKRIIDAHYSGFAGIAISAAGLVDRETLFFGKGCNFYPIFGQSLVQFLENHYHCPISVENDGNCAALAELWLGTGKNYQNFLTIVIGTGIGGAVIQQGQLIRGKDELAGEFGFKLYRQIDGSYQVWSNVGSTKFLIANVCTRKGILSDALNGKEIFALEEQGDSIAHEEIAKFIEMIAVNAYELQYTLDPEVILIGGGVSAAPGLIERINSRIQVLGRTIPDTVILPTVQACHFRNEANLIGAAHDWFQQFS